MTPGDWSTIANVNVQATLPYTGSNVLRATRYDHRSSDVQQRKFCAECPQQRRWLYLANEYQQACRVLPHCPRRNAAKSELSKSSLDYNIGTYGAGHATEVQDLTHLWDYFQGTVTDPVTAAPIVAGVPEPSTWVMMLIGFLGLGAAARRFRRNVSFA